MADSFNISASFFSAFFPFECPTTRIWMMDADAMMRILPFSIARRNGVIKKCKNLEILPRCFGDGSVKAKANGVDMATPFEVRQ